MTALPQGAALDPIALRAQAGDPEATALLLRGLERLLWKKAVVPAARFHGLWHRTEDLAQMAKIAVMRWLPDWDGSRRATTYLVAAAFWELHRRGDRLKRTVHVPVYAIEQHRQLPRIAAKRERGEALTKDEQRIIERAPYVVAALKAPASIHPHDGNEGGAAFLLGCEDKPREPPDDIRDLLGLLSARERFVVERRYGLFAGREWTLEEVAAAMPREAQARGGGVRTVGQGLSRERVRQIEARALVKMRRHLGAPLYVSAKRRRVIGLKLAEGA